MGGINRFTAPATRERKNDPAAMNRFASKDWKYPVLCMFLAKAVFATAYKRAPVETRNPSIAAAHPTRTLSAAFMSAGAMVPTPDLANHIAAKIPMANATTGEVVTNLGTEKGVQVCLALGLRLIESCIYELRKWASIGSEQNLHCLNDAIRNEVNWFRHVFYLDPRDSR